MNRPAKCLPVLRAQLDVAYPRRKHTLDFYEGDDAHKARVSDHNADNRGIIHAYDITHDPAAGCDVQKVADAIIESRDYRVHYMIHKSRIANPTIENWKWRPYGGPGKDPHNGHLHLSVNVKGEDDTRPWQIIPGVKPVAVPKQPNFRSLVPGGYFSADPFDTRVNTSIRTNNPGALNASPWVKAYPGYVGDKVTSMSGASANNTAIFETPEQGIAVYFELLKRYRAAGAKTVSEIIKKYGGGQDYSAYIDFVVKRTGLRGSDEIKLTGDDATLIKFAKAMWRYEAGKETPLSDAQIVYGINLARKSGGTVVVGIGTTTGVGTAVVVKKVADEGFTTGNVVLIVAVSLAAVLGIVLLVRWLKK